jgi:hypothetical protein
MHDVFISYARQDRHVANQIASLLTQMGLRVWFDVEIPVGADFDAEISRRLSDSKSVLVIWSTSSVNSRWVRGEAREALAQGKLIPVAIEEVSPPIDLRSIQTTSLKGWSGDPASPDFQAVISALNKIISGAIPADRIAAASQTFRSRRRSRLAYWTAGVALLPLMILSVANLDRLQDAAQSLSDLEVYLIPNGVAPKALEAGASSLVPTLEKIVDDELGQVLAAIERSKKISDAQALKNEIPETDAWGVSQFLMSSSIKAPQASVQAYYDYTKQPQCGCWGPVEGGQHAVATAWVFLVHAKYGLKIDNAVLLTVLNKQGIDGSWPLFFDATPDPRNSSTYATTYLLLALNALVGSNSVSVELAPRVRSAIRNASSWLITNQPPAKTFWRDYPRGASRVQASRGVSVLAIQALMQSVNDERAVLALNEWVRTMEQPTSIDSVESSDQFIRLLSGETRRDTTRYVVSAWEVATLIRYYPKLDTSNKVKAHRLLRQASRLPLSREILEVKFVVAESLYAFRTVEGSASDAGRSAAKS